MYIRVIFELLTYQRSHWISLLHILLYIAYVTKVIERLLLAKYITHDFPHQAHYIEHCDSPR